MNLQELHSEPSISDLEGIIAVFAHKEKRYQAEIKILKEQIQLLTDRLFGRKTEKNILEDKQLLLFEEKEDNACIPEPPEEEIIVPSHTRKKRGRKAIPDDLPRVEVVHDIDEADKVCECGCLKTVFGQDVSEQYDVIPPQYRVIRHVRLKYGCKSCEGVDSEKPAVMIAPVPVTLIPKGNATAGLIAYIISQKFVDALPFYRQEKILARHGVIIPRSTLCNWAIRAAECCLPLLEFLKKELASGPLINIDETTVQVHNEPGRKNTSQSYMWIFCGGPPTAPVYIYTYDPTRAGQVAKDYLGTYRGYVQTDGYAGYHFLESMKTVHHVGCFAHARRKFIEAAKVVPRAKQGEPLISGADEAVLFIKKLYAVEKEACEKGLGDDQKTALRLEKTRPILDEFKAWLDKNALITVPKSALGKAIAYTLSQWSRLVRYIEQGYISPDNNRAENAIRPFVIGRKNWLFSDTPKGAQASATLYSLIETAKANGLEPYQYLKYIFGKLPHAVTEDDYKALLPQYLDRDDMAAFIQGVVY
jgi:transposase